MEARRRGPLGLARSWITSGLAHLWFICTVPLVYSPFGYPYVSATSLTKTHILFLITPLPTPDISLHEAASEAEAARGICCCIIQEHS